MKKNAAADVSLERLYKKTIRRDHTATMDADSSASLRDVNSTPSDLDVRSVISKDR